MGTDEWKLPVDDEETLREFVKMHSGIQDNSIKVNNIYVTNVAIVVHITMANDIEKFKEPLGRILRFVGGCAEQFGYILPVFAVIYAPESSKKAIEKWSADQDWHHGDFSLIYGSGDSSDIIEDLIGDSKVAFRLEKMEPLDVDAIKARLGSEIESNGKNLSDEYNRLLESVLNALNNDKVSIKDAISNWVDEELKRIESLN